MEAVGEKERERERGREREGERVRERAWERERERERERVLMKAWETMFPNSSLKAAHALYKERLDALLEFFDEHVFPSACAAKCEDHFTESGGLLDALVCAAEREEAFVSGLTSDRPDKC